MTVEAQCCCASCWRYWEKWQIKGKRQSVLWLMRYGIMKYLASLSNLKFSFYEWLRLVLWGICIFVKENKMTQSNDKFHPNSK